MAGCFACDSCLLHLHLVLNVTEDSFFCFLFSFKLFNASCCKKLQLIGVALWGYLKFFVFVQFRVQLDLKLFYG